jgi:exopolyphosphatase / guanosine-5'-triphosphate,3'-diphosphate pyrophosphatase
VTGAVLSVGTNSTRGLLADYDSDGIRVPFARSIGTRIGEGLGRSGDLRPEAIARTLRALDRLHRELAGRYDRLWAVTTSAVRRADNATVFLEFVRERFGVQMDVLSGPEEARAAYRGAAAAVRPIPGERIGVVDSGGGSTEFAIGSGIEPDAVVSCEIGAVVLTEAVPELSGRSGPVSAAAVERARTLARVALEPLRAFERGAKVALVGGSASTAGAIARGGLLGRDVVDLSRADLQRVLRRLCSLDLDRRKRMRGMRVQRADILPAGIVILDTALELLEARCSVASRWDLLLGVLLDRVERAEAEGAGGR